MSEPAALPELRVYDCAGNKRFVLLDGERFIAALQEWSEVDGGVYNNTLCHAFAAAILAEPEDDYHAPPHYFKIEVLLPDVEPRDYEDAEFERQQRLTQAIYETWWGPWVEWLMCWCERKLYGDAR